MFSKLILISALAALAIAEPVPKPKNRCDVAHPNAGLSATYWESIAHAIHSLDMEALAKLTKNSVSADNHVPTVNLEVTRSSQKVLPNAPSRPIGNDFFSEEMNLIDSILERVGKSDDGLGKFWSPLERVVHAFHMRDLWAKLKPMVDSIEVDAETCSCLLSVEESGVTGAVGWVANHYAHGTPITLLNRPISKLTNSQSWSQWKGRLLHYYNSPALHDAAYYLKCAL